MLRKYWQKCRRSVELWAVFGVVFVVSFWLYRLPVMAAVYPTLVCGVIGGVALAVDYAAFVRQQRRLSRIRGAADFTPADLPDCRDAAQEAYTRIITLLYEEQERQRRQAHDRLTDMTDYYTVWAHQIKTPIASMRLYLQGEDTPLSHRVLAQLNRIEQYVEMVMTFLRLDSETTDYVFREYAVDDIARQAVRKFSGEFIARRLRLDFQPTGIVAVTDEKWLTFVIEQLLSNALKYTHTGGITVCAAAERVLEIRDTGIGIAPEDLPRVFEKGYTGFNGRNDKRASGIGLYLCRRVCTNLSIPVRITSTPDVGTAVQLDFSQDVTKL